MSPVIGVGPICSQNFSMSTNFRYDIDTVDKRYRLVILSVSLSIPSLLAKPVSGGAQKIRARRPAASHPPSSFHITYLQALKSFFDPYIIEISSFCTFILISCSRYWPILFLKVVGCKFVVAAPVAPVPTTKPEFLTSKPRLLAYYGEQRPHYHNF